MPRGNPSPSPETRFKKGQTGNPGGKTSEQVAIERRNAETAMRIREKLLCAMSDKIDDFLKADENGEAPDKDKVLAFVEASALKLLKDAEERGPGAPKQSVTVAMDLGTALDTLDDD